MIIIESYALECDGTCGGCFSNWVAIVDNTSKDQTSKQRKDSLVITPGGPRSRERVHPVGPGETLRRNPDGTYTVVPDAARRNKQESTPKK
jgi:hypothetical protein